MKNLLVEYIAPSINKMRLYESTNRAGISAYFVECILQRAGQPGSGRGKNQNGRYYSKPILIREQKKYTESYIKENRAYGELDHPDSSVVEVKNACHTVEELWWNGDDMWGKLELLNTPSGNIVKNILQAGKTLGISSRGLGSVRPVAEEAGAVEVQDDYELLCFDIVSNPSTQGAFLRSVNESVDFKNTNQAKKYFYVNNLINDILKGK